MFLRRLASNASQQRGAFAAAFAVGTAGLFGLHTAEPSQSKIADCDASASASANTTNEPALALSSKEFRPFKLLKAEKVSHNTKLYRFQLPSEEHEAGLSVMSCLVAKAEVDGKNVVRAYTPVSTKHQKGHLDLLIKVYPSPGGLMSRHVDGLKVGDTLQLKGPFKKVDYKPNMKKNICMVAGGTGITPMLQLIREVLSNPEDHTELRLIFANISEEDILLRDELDALQYLYPSFKVYYTLDKPPSGWKMGQGFVSEEMLTEHFPSSEEDTFVLVCGPKGLVTHIAGEKNGQKQGEIGGLLKKLNFTEDQVFKF